MPDGSKTDKGAQRSIVVGSFTNSVLDPDAWPCRGWRHDNCEHGTRLLGPDDHAKPARRA